MPEPTEHTANLQGGRNIAMKVPPRDFAATVAFYEKTIGLPVCGREESSVTFEFGACRLWVDRVEGLAHAEVWLELQTGSIAAASDLLDKHAVTRCDDIEPLPDGLPAFWIKNPAGVVHLVTERA